MLRIGEQVGAYQIVEQLGQGGMATVYKAYHPQLDRYVAIKVMHQNFLEDANFRVRFEREAQIVARLEHPHIVPVYDFNHHNEQPYLVMKLIEGKTLKQLALKSPLTLQQILHIFTAVGSALAYAHQKGVLHRDIKPSNIVIDADNTPYLADFGLARIVQAGESTMSADMLLGTPHYISPEQARGQKDIDGRADIYSLGVVLYELLTGRVPFTADTPYAIIHDHIYSPLPLPSIINPEISPQIEAVLLKALEKNPQDRYTTASEFVEDFQRGVQESKLFALNPDRASIALKNLEQNRTASIITPSPHTPAFTPPSLSTAASATIYEKNPSGRFWMLSGCAGFIIVCLLGLGIVLSMLDSILQIAELTQTSLLPPEVSAEIERANFVYDVPDESVESATIYVEQQPQDPIGYLALAKAHWQENGTPNDIIQTIKDGLIYEDDLPRYLITAAIIAEENEAYIYSFAYVLLGAEVARQNGDIRDQIRHIAGQIAYYSAERLTLSDAQEALKIIEDMGYTDIARQATNSQIYKFFALRERMINNQLILAQRAFNNLSDPEQSLPEARLLYIELMIKQGNRAQALAEITQILGLEDAPSWVKTEATKLLDSIQG